MISGKMNSPTHSALQPSPSINRVWKHLRRDAMDVANKEPMLGDFISLMILNHENFDAALVARLALRLESQELSSAVLCENFTRATREDQSIGISAQHDLVAVVDRDPACHRLIDPFLYFKGWQAVQLHRIAHWFWKKGEKDFAYFIQSRTSVVTSVDIHPAAQIGKGIMIDHGHDVVIGETSIIEDNVSMMQGVTLGGTGKEVGDRQPKIRQGVLIGAGAKILGNIEIGRGSRIAAGSVVLNPVPANTTVAGIPARVVGNSGSVEPAINMDHQIESDES